MTVESANIMPGFACTMSCGHCFNASSPEQQGHLSKAEIGALVRGLKETRPHIINMSGGEPTLYLDLYRNILHQLCFDYHLLLTTNGHFATSPECAANILSRCQTINSIQLSFDCHHNRDLNSDIPFVLKDYCAKKRIEFVMTICIRDPQDLLFVREVESKYQCKVSFQKIDGAGRARLRGTEFIYPAFDHSVLSHRCPNARTLSFIYNKGFSQCCGNVIFNIDSDEYGHHSLDDLRRRRFYRETTEMTFGERLRKYHMDSSNLASRYSSPCNLCEYIEKHRQNTNL